MRSRKAFAWLLIALLLVSLCACSAKKSGETQDAALSGGWTEQEDTELSEKEKEIFRKAVAGTEYEAYEVTALAGTQVVAGTNYRFLCKDADGNEKTVTVYCDLEDNCSVTSVE